ncbi:MAG: phosphomannomutase/phosphoglucomutase [Gammaproteobacteria bacterium WSBS_2016_MAG_OTU1]
MTTPPPSIFKANDIRGIYEQTLTEDGARHIGRALAAAVLQAGGTRIALARDGRLSSPALAKALAQGIGDGGVITLDIGLAPTPALYHAAFSIGDGNGVMITGSHNPPAHNGMKMVVGGKTLRGESVKELLNAPHSATPQTAQEVDIRSDYIAAVVAAATPSKSLHIVVDAGNGVAGAYAPQLYEQLGHRVTSLFCDVDGNFPNHHPDPAQPKNLIDARIALAESGADIAFIFDGDGDRLGVLLPGDEDWIFPDRLLMLLARDVLLRHTGSRVVFDVKCSGHLSPWIKHHGGIPDMQPTGHAFIKSRMQETGALLGGEMSGHFYFAENWPGFDDALLAGAKLASIFATDKNAMRDIPRAAASPEIVLDIGDANGRELIATIKERAHFATAENIIDIDGLRVEYADGFGLVRASNTTASLVLRFEGEDDAALERIKKDFNNALALIDCSLD